MAWTALSGLVPLYPLYALLFLDTGLSDAEVSGLFALWSGTALLAEVPAGALADRWSRRGVLALSGVLEAAGFALWTAAPGGPAFATGFVLWGVAEALASGTVEALVYDGLAAVEAEDGYALLNGRMTAAELLVQVPTAAAATVLVTTGGYPLVGWVSTGVCLAAAAVALRFPEPPRTPADGGPGWAGALRQGVGEALRRPGLRGVVLAVALVGGLDAVEEYLPVMARDWGVPTPAVPVAVLAVALAGALGAALGGRAARPVARRLPALLALSAACLAAAGLWARATALAPLAVAYGLYLAVLVVSEARLQERIEGPYRATVTSVAGLGIEVAALLVFAAWALAGALAVAALFLAVVPVVAVCLAAGAPSPRS